MKTKFMFAGLAGGVTSFFVGWLVYGVLLMDFFTSNTIHYDGLAKEMPDMILLALSNLLTGYFFAFVFYYWAKINGLKAGLIGGAILGLFLITAYDLSFFSMYNLYNTKAAIADILVGIAFYSIIGAVVGLVLTDKKSES